MQSLIRITSKSGREAQGDFGMLETRSGVMEDRLYTSRETAKILGICERSLWEISAPRGALPCVRINRSVRYDPTDIAAFIEASKGGIAK
jgi:hypothetical protein